MINKKSKRLLVAFLGLLFTLSVAIFIFSAIQKESAIGETVPTPQVTYTVSSTYHQGRLNATSLVSATPLTNVDVGSKIYFGYEVKNSNVNATQFGILSSTDPSVGGTDVWNKNSGRLQFGSFNMYEKGSKYFVEVTVNATNTFVNTVTKTTSDNTVSENSFKSVAGSGFSNANSNYFGIWASEGGIGDIVLENVFFMDENGNDLGVQLDGGRKDYYFVSKDAESAISNTLTQNNTVSNIYVHSELPYSGIGSKMVMEYTVDDVTTNSITQSGGFTTSSYDASWPYTTLNGGNMKYRANGLCVDKGYSYKFFFERVESDVLVSAYRISTSTGAYENLYYPSSASATPSGETGYFGIWLGGSVSGLKISNFKAYDESGKAYGVYCNSSNVSNTIDVKDDVVYSGKSYAVKLEGTKTNSIAISSNTVKGNIFDTVYMEYHVSKVATNTITQIGVILTKDNTASYPFSSNAGRLLLDKTKSLLEVGADYKIIFVRTSQLKYIAYITKTNSSGSTSWDTTSYTPATDLTNDDVFGYYSLWFSEGKLSGVLLDNFRCYDLDGNDLGVKVNNSSFTVTENPETVSYTVNNYDNTTKIETTSVPYYSTYTLPASTSANFVGWLVDGTLYNAGDSVILTKDVVILEKVEYCGQSYKIVANNDAAQRICISSNTKRDNVGDIVTLEYYVSKAVNVTINQTGFTITNDNARDFTYRGGTMYFKSGCPILDEGYSYKIVYTRTSVTTYTVSVTKKNASDVESVVDISSYGLTNSLAEGEYGYFGLHLSEGGIGHGTVLDNIRCYDQYNNDLKVTINDVHLNAKSFTISENPLTVTYSVKSANNTDIVAETLANYYSKITLPTSYSTDSVLGFSDGTNMYKKGDKVTLTKDLVITELDLCVITSSNVLLKECKMSGTEALSTTKYGIRWIAGVNKIAYDSILSYYGENFKVGVLIAPLDKITSTFDFDNLEESSYLNLVANSYSTSLTATKNDGNIYFYASIDKIDAGNLNRSYAARTYVQITDGGITTTYYGNYDQSVQAKSVYGIACAEYGENYYDNSFISGIISSVLYINAEGNIVAPAGYDTTLEAEVTAESITITGDKDELDNIKLVVRNNGTKDGNYRFTRDAQTGTITVNLSE